MSKAVYGTLYLVSTPIGNKLDISLRALKVLRSADIVACEEIKTGRRLLASYDINRDLIPLNEHNESEQTEVILDALRQKNDVALFSDAGAPLLADPGTELVRRCIEEGIPVTSIPGADSLIPALQLSGFAAESFLFIGWLSPKKETRREQLHKLKSEKRLMIFIEAPYRLLPLLRDLRGIFGGERRASVAFDLTTEKETVYRDSLSSLLHYFERNPRKGEFVIITEGS